MSKLSEYLRAISQRGDPYGKNNGVLDLLDWCGKQNTAEVTEEEALLFLQNPHAEYPAALRKKGTTEAR